MYLIIRNRKALTSDGILGDRDYSQSLSIEQRA